MASNARRERLEARIAAERIEHEVDVDHDSHGRALERPSAWNAMPGLAVKGRGVIFDQGKRALGVPLGIYSGDTLVASIGPLICEPSVRLGS